MLLFELSHHTQPTPHTTPRNGNGGVHALPDGISHQSQPILYMNKHTLTGETLNGSF